MPPQLRPGHFPETCNHSDGVVKKISTPGTQNPVQNRPNSPLLVIGGNVAGLCTKNRLPVFCAKDVGVPFWQFYWGGVTCFAEPLDLQLRIGKAAGTNWSAD